MNKLNLQQQAEQILCSKHKLPIVQLNISKETPIGDRLICRKCQTLNQANLFIETVEEYLMQWLNEEQQQFQKESDRLEAILSLIEREKQIFEKLLETYLQDMKRNYQSILKQQKEFVERQHNLFKEKASNTHFQSIYHQIFDDNLSATILQKLAQFLSDQTIENGNIKLKKNPDISEIKQKIIGVANLFYELNFKLSSKENNEHANLKNELVKINQTLFENRKEFKLIQLEGHTTTVCSIAMTNNDSMVASGDTDGLIILWRLSNKQKIQNYKTQCPICDLTFSQDNKLLAACQFLQPYEVLIFDVVNTEITSPTMKLKGHIDSIYRIMFTFDSKYLISGSYDKMLKIWDFKNQSVIFQQKFPTELFGLCMSQNTKYFSVCCGNGQAYLFDCQSMPQLRQITNWLAHSGKAFGTTFTPDSEFVLTSFGEVKFWSVRELLSKNGKKLEPSKIIQGDSYMWSLLISLNGELLISNDEKIKIWKLASGELIDQIDVPDGYEYADERNFGVTTDMKYIVTGGSNYKLKIFQISY